MIRFYAIYNAKTEELKTANGASTLPALYRTYGIANGVLKKLKSYGEFRSPNWQVREVELTIR